MQKKLYCKILAIGIVVLLIGVSYSTAISINTKPIIEENEDDCGCGEVSDTDLIKVEGLLNRVEVYSKLLLVLSKYNPLIIEKSPKLLRIFNMDRFLDNDVICISLFFIVLFVSQFLSYITWILTILRESSIFFKIFLSIHYKIQNIIYGILDLMEELECEIDITPP